MYKQTAVNSAEALPSTKDADALSHSTHRWQDSWVYRGLYPFIWRCPQQVLSAWMQKHLNPQHLQIGCQPARLLTDAFNQNERVKQITLVDPNARHLRHCQERLTNTPTSRFQLDFAQNLHFGGQTFTSIGICDALAQIRGPLEQQCQIFDRLTPHLADRGVIYGWTPVHYASDTSLLRNLSVAKRPDLHILEEHPQSTGFRQQLEKRFQRVVIKRIGTVLLFAASP